MLLQGSVKPTAGNEERQLFVILKDLFPSPELVFIYNWNENLGFSFPPLYSLGPQHFRNKTRIQLYVKLIPLMQSWS